MSSSQTRIAQARTFLFVPGNRPDRFVKALQTGADAVVFDLEDAVGIADKEQARAEIAAAWSELQQHGVPLVVRCNSVTSDLGKQDIAWAKQLTGDWALLVPKAESAQALAHVHATLPQVPLLPLIESAQGYAAMRELAAVEGVCRLALGHLDFMADTGLQCSEDESELAPLRFEIAMATRLSGLAPAIDGVTTALQDGERLCMDVQRALRFGFGGKLCIHPRQVEGVHQAMQPSAEELDWAHRVVAADESSGGSAVQVDGKMVDQPVVQHARRFLARAR